MESSNGVSGFLIILTKSLLLSVIFTLKLVGTASADEMTYAFLIHFRSGSISAGFAHSAVLFGKKESGLDRKEAFVAIANTIMDGASGYNTTDGSYTNIENGYVSWRNHGKHHRDFDHWAIRTDFKSGHNVDIISLPETAPSTVSLQIKYYLPCRNNCAQVARNVLSQLYPEIQDTGGLLPKNLKAKIRLAFPENGQLVDLADDEDFGLVLNKIGYCP